MAFAAALNTTLNIIDAAGRTLSNLPVKEAGQVMRQSMTAGGAITSLSAQTNILSRSFVDESVIDEPILPNLTRCLHEWYTAQIIAALHLNQVVAGKRTVQDVMTVVQTGQNSRQGGGGSYISSAASHVWNTVAKRNVAQESFLENYLGVESDGRSFGMEDIYGPMTRDQVGKIDKGKWDKRVNDAIEDKKDSPSDSQVNVRSVASSEHRIGPMGELYELKLTNPEGGATTIVPLFIQMQPSIVPAEIAPRFIDLNVSPSWWQRWVQMRAGELTFWRDFLLNRDLIRRQKSIIKDRKTADAFTDFLKTVSKKDTYAIGDATDRLGSRQSANLANSVMIFSEDSVAQAKADSGIDLHNAQVRSRYFRDTYTMIIVIIDSLHQRVTVYFNGLDGEINAPYSEFRPKDTKFDPKDFMVALQAFSTNNISRMR